MKRKKPTLKQAKFMSEYLKDGNATKAVRAAYPGITTDGAQRVMGHRLLTNANLQEQVKEALQEAGLTLELIAQQLTKLITSPDESQQNKAIRTAAEIIGLMGRGGLYQQINVQEGRSMPQMSDIEQKSMTAEQKWQRLRNVLDE